MSSVTYDRPVEATLHVHLANGETFEAAAEDLKKFGYIKRDVTFSNMYQRLVTLFDDAGLFGDEYRDTTDLQVAPLYAFFSYVLTNPELIDHWENEALMVEIVNVERRLRGLEPLPVPSYEEMRAKRDQNTNN